MKIKYLKSAPNAATGDIKDIPTSQARILITLGFAEPYDADTQDTGENGELFGDEPQLGEQAQNELDDQKTTDDTTLDEAPQETTPKPKTKAKKPKTTDTETT